MLSEPASASPVKKNEVSRFTFLPSVLPCRRSSWKQRLEILVRAGAKQIFRQLIMWLTRAANTRTRKYPRGISSLTGLLTSETLPQRVITHRVKIRIALLLKRIFATYNFILHLHALIHLFIISPSAKMQKHCLHRHSTLLTVNWFPLVRSLRVYKLIKWSGRIKSLLFMALATVHVPNVIRIYQTIERFVPSANNGRVLMILRKRSFDSSRFTV